MTTYIYFLRCGEYVKIGRSRKPGKRLMDLARSNPYECEMLLVLPAMADDMEYDLHRTFAQHRWRGEWFTLASEIWSYVKSREHSCMASTAGVWPQKIANWGKGVAKRAQTGARRQCGVS